MTDMSDRNAAHAVRGAVSTVLAVIALLTGVLVTPAGAQALPTATAGARCFRDGPGVVEVTSVDPTARWSHRFLIDGEEANAVTGGQDTYWVLVPGDGTYDLVVTAETAETVGEPVEILSAEVTVDCDVEPTTTDPRMDDGDAARGLSFTG